MAASRIVARLLSAGWCVFTPSAVVSVYLGIGVVVVFLVRDPIIGTAVLGGLVVALLGTTRTLRPRWFAYAPGPPPTDGAARFVWVVLGCAILAFLAGQSLALWLYATAGSDAFDQSTQTRQAAGVATTLLLTLVAAPAGEEALFRGLLYPLLRKRVGVLAAMSVTTVAFGLLHGNVVQFALTLPLAVVLALLYEHTRTLWPCVLLHLGFNLAATLVPARALTPLATPITTALLCLAFTWSVWMLYRQVVGGVARVAVKSVEARSPSSAGRYLW